MGLLWFVVIAARKLLPAWRAPQPGCTRAAPDGLDHEGGAGALSLPLCRSPRPGSCERRPLRVVRVRESGQLPGHAGRMKISGRMADVCAELDRLAAHEDLAGTP